MKNRDAGPRHAYISVRIPAELRQLLHAEAIREGVSLNGLLTRLLTKYAYFDRYAKHTGAVVTPTSAFMRLIELASEEELYQLAEEVGVGVVKPMFAFFNLRRDFATLLAHYLEPMGLYSGWFSFSYKQEESKHLLTLRHEYGPKWSSFLRQFMATMLRSVLGLEPRIEAEEKKVRVSLQ